MDIDSNRVRRRMPVGAELQPGGVHFRVWAPRSTKVEVVLGEGLTLADAVSASGKTLGRETGGYFSGLVAEARAGNRYGFRLDGGARLLPDPASRFQPDGPHGLSQVVDPGAYAWGDQAWRGVTLRGQVIYELHVGTFTEDGTWQAATAELPRLADLGVTLLEVMPVADFPGQFGWGYDGVNLFAPTRLYGPPDEFRTFVDRAHGLGLGVLLDVVYNHFGPDGNYLSQFAADYFTERFHTDWGEAINFDGPQSGPVREFFIANAGYWMDEFHLDGLRIDAVQAIYDASAEHILAAIGRQVRAAAGGRGVLVVGENELQDAHLMRPIAHGGAELDAAWNDDFHHAARVALTGHADHYYGDYRGTPQELVSAVKWGYLYQGQWNTRQQRRRGSPALDVEAPRFVTFLQNHDQVGNTPYGWRLHDLTSPGRLRAITALLLLAPGTPMLFQGQEYCASSPFHYFADHEAGIGQLVRWGREEAQRQFRCLAGDDAAAHFVDPCDRETFRQSKLRPPDARHGELALALHRDLLALRKRDAVFAAQDAGRVHGAVLADEAFLLRFLGPQDDDRLLLVNLGRQLDLRPLTEPLAVAPRGRGWQLLWSSEDPKYGGLGSGTADSHLQVLPGHAAVVLQSTSPEPAQGSNS